MNSSHELKNNRILVIDDNRAIHEDIRKILCGGAPQNEVLADAKAELFGEDAPEESSAAFEIDSAFQGEEGLRKVQQAAAAGRPYAMAFVDVRMPPGWDGIETVTRIWRDYPDLQVVICTAYSDYTWEQMIGHLGKSDSLLILKKPFDNIEVLQLAHALTDKWALRHQVNCRLNDLDALVNQRTAELQQANEKLKQEIAERMQMERALRLSEERFSKAFKASPIPLAIQSLRQSRYVDINEGFQEITGFGREELIGHTAEELQLWADPNGGQGMLRLLREQMAIRNLPTRFRVKSGELRDVLLSVELFELDGEPFLLIIAQDISEQMRLENQLRQAQKLEAIGQLAAGVAHDFNNILTVVQGNASLLLGTQPPESRERRPLQTICDAADRAGKLVRQLLTFSRKQVLQSRPMDVRDTLTAISDMLPRLLGENIATQVLAPDGLPQIHADPSMIEQILLNLAVNARDAMPQGGRLAIGAEAVEISAEAARRSPDMQPGRFICLSVSDTGCGIAPEVLPRIFEPFFTTKGVGQGTGLGLATVYGAARQHRGWVEVQSQLGQGTTFRVFIPAYARQTDSPPAPAVTSELTGGNETILVVEDEADVRDFVGEVLKSHGYTVLAAGSGAQALAQWPGYQKPIHLLLTDMVMPDGVNGRELAERLLVLDPGLRVIYTSGYSPGMAGKDLTLLEGNNFLPKPYRPAKLLRMVRESLDCHPAPEPAKAAEPVLQPS